jgi:hypothetical protein
MCGLRFCCLQKKCPKSGQVEQKVRPASLTAGQRQAFRPFRPLRQPCWQAGLLKEVLSVFASRKRARLGVKDPPMKIPASVHGRGCKNLRAAAAEQSQEGRDEITQHLVEIQIATHVHQEFEQDLGFEPGISFHGRGIPGPMFC